MTSSTPHVQDPGPQRVPAGVRAGGQFAAAPRNEADVTLQPGPRRPRRRCPMCRRPVEDTCTNPTCDEFDMANPDARFVDLPIRAWALQPGDKMPDGATVIDAQADPPGRPGRTVTLRTDRGLSHPPINQMVTTTRLGRDQTQDQT